MTNFIFFLISGILGLCSVVFPVFMLSGIKFYDSPVFPLVRTGIEGLSLLSIVFLTMSGIIIGFVKPRFFWLWSVSIIWLFPIISIIEMVIDPYSHNLWPIEFLIYIFMSIPAVVGATIGSFIKGN